VRKVIRTLKNKAQLDCQKSETPQLDTQVAMPQINKPLLESDDQPPVEKIAFIQP